MWVIVKCISYITQLLIHALKHLSKPILKLSDTNGYASLSLRHFLAKVLILNIGFLCNTIIRGHSKIVQDLRVDSFISH